MLAEIATTMQTEDRTATKTTKPLLLSAVLHFANWILLMAREDMHLHSHVTSMHEYSVTVKRETEKDIRAGRSLEMNIL